MSNQIERRREAATAGRQYLAKELSADKFIGEFGESEDQQIAILVDLIEHEPKRGGLAGANERDWLGYQDQISKAVAELERNESHTEVKQHAMPGLSSGSFMIVSWTILAVSAVIGFCIGIPLFPNSFENGQLKGFGIPATVVVTAMFGQLLFWYLWKKGWKSK